MRTTEVSALELFNSGRWRVEIFTDDNSENIKSRWASVRIAEIAEDSNRAIEPREYRNDELLYVGLENVESITGDAVDLEPRQKKEIKSRSKVFTSNCVLYGRLRPYLRKVFLASGKYSEGLCSTEFFVLKPRQERVLPEILRALLASEAIAKQLARLQVGAALPRVSSSDFFRATVPLPPMDVQKIMKARLEQVQEERLRLKARLQEMPGEFEKIISEIFLM